MMVTRAQAEEATQTAQSVKSANVDAKTVALSRKVAQEVLVKAELLEPSERLCAVVELATTF